MPTYEYSCNVCRNQFEVEQKITDANCAECPACKVACHNRLIPGGTIFSLKGDGWASDNYSKRSS